MKINSKRGFSTVEYDDANIIAVNVSEMQELALYNKDGEGIDLIKMIRSEDDWCLNIRFKSFDSIGITSWIQIGSDNQMDFGQHYDTKEALQFRLDNLEEQSK